MRFSTLIPLLPLAAQSVLADTIAIDVGESGLVFSPNNPTAKAGDQLVFTFYPKAHSVTQSTFDAPCQQKEGGFNSGFVPVSSGAGGTFTVTVNDTNPIWIYCAQTSGTHCQKGMVMAVNAPTSGNTLDAYTTASKATTNSTVGTAVVGGILSSNGTSSSGGNSTATTTGGSGPTPTASSTSSLSTGAAAALATGGFEWAVMGGAAVLGGLFI